MVLSLVAALTLGSANVITLDPTDDVWAYPHASEPGKDMLMRVWGANGEAVPVNSADSGDFSFGYIKFAISGVDDVSKLKSAKLVVTQSANPGYSLEQVKEFPLQARLVDASFTEKDWQYDAISKYFPKAGKNGVAGFGAPEEIKEGQPVSIAIDLMKGPDDFKAALGTALRSSTRTIAFTLTTPMDVTVLGRSAIFKIFTKEAEVAANRPKLLLEFED